MNKLIVSLVAVAAIGVVGCQKKLDTDERKSSYAIGQQIGRQLKQQSIEFDPDLLVMALKDAQKGESKLDDKGLQEAMMKLQEMAMKKSQEKAEGNLKKSNEFLEKNKTTEGVKVTASGLQYIVLKEGTGKTPTDEDFVKCHYTGTLVDGTKFDSSVDRGQPAEFPVRGVIPGWTEALKLMKEGGKLKLFIPPGLAYGPAERPGIPGNSALVFEVELIEIVKKQAPAAAPKAAPKKK